MTRGLLQAQFCLAQLGRWIENALIVICGLLLCAMASSVFFEVLIRYVIHAPTAWTEETAQFVLVWYGLRHARRTSYEIHRLEFEELPETIVETLSIEKD